MKRCASRVRLVVSALALPLLVSCSSKVAAPGSGSESARTAREETARLESLRVFERELRARRDPRAPPSSETTFGADPWAIRRLPSTHTAPGLRARWVGILRGRSAIVLLDESLQEVARAPAPRSTTGLALVGGIVAVAGELASEVALFSIDNDAFVRSGALDLGAEGVRALATGPEGALAASTPVVRALTGSRRPCSSAPRRELW